MKYRTGCAIWGFRGWLGNFYPRGAKLGDALRLYAERFTAVEGNTTFYATPTAEVVDRWAGETPERFRFCPKLPRAVTHAGALTPRVDEVRRFVDRLARLGPRMGPLFGILPAEYGPERVRDLERFLTGLRDTFGGAAPALALEARCPAWYQPPHSLQLNGLLRAHGVGRVLLDTRPIYSQAPAAREHGDPQAASQRRKPELPVSLAVTAPFTFIRFIAHPRPDVTGPYLAQWLPRVRDWLTRDVAVYFFAHCPDDTHSPGIARRFHRALAERGAAVEPLPWDRVAEAPRQLALV